MPLFDDQTPEEIRSRILARWGTTLQTREGSFCYDMSSPVSFEIWRVIMTLQELVSAFYVDEYSGTHLDSHAALLGLERRAGTAAAAVMTFAGTDGTQIPAGTTFFTASGLEFTLDETVVIANGTAAGSVTAVKAGEAYNVDAGEIKQILRNISGLSSYSNEAATGGTDAESDSALYARIVARRKNPATSGNPSHYIEWAMTCDGIGAAKVTRLWNGPGTVRVIVVGYDYKPVDDGVLEACAAYVCEQKPIGADATVITAEAAQISVTAALTLDSSTTLDTVQSAFETALASYLGAVASEYFASRVVYDYTVYYNRIAALLMGIDGVTDYADLQVNGGTGNILISGTAVPVVGEVTLQ